jgi:hypothetical protein
MPGKFNYEVRHKYPHLIGEDIEVWNRFILKYPDKFYTVDYDVKVGLGADTTPIPDEVSKQYWATLTKKRIDVVAWKDNSVTIIEVKKRVSLSTLGQILGYKFLYLREHPEIPVVSTLIVCSSINQDDIDVLKHYGINFVIV